MNLIGQQLTMLDTVDDADNPGAFVRVDHSPTVDELQMLEPEQLDGRTWRLSWSYTGSADTFYLWLNGELAATTALQWFDVSGDPGEPLVVEVFDDSTESPSPTYPSRMRLGWFASTGAPAASSYRIDQYIAAAWVKRAAIPEDGRGFYQWVTRSLDDDTSHQFRIVPVAANGNEGTPVSFTALMVRHPDEPDVAIAYSSSTRKLTISAN